MDFVTETIAVKDLKEHPQNYRQHDKEQIEHIVASIKEYGLYRNIVIAKDNTILAGHGVVQAAQILGLSTVPVYRLDIDCDSLEAKRLLIGDNLIGHLAIQDDRLLTDLLKEIRDFDPNELLGTGFDEAMLANLVYVTRDRNEIRDFDAAKEWINMPEYGEPEQVYRIVILCPSAEIRANFLEEKGLSEYKTDKASTISIRYPKRPIDDALSLRFE